MSKKVQEHKNADTKTFYLHNHSAVLGIYFWPVDGGIVAN